MNTIDDSLYRRALRIHEAQMKQSAAEPYRNKLKRKGARKRRS